MTSQGHVGHVKYKVQKWRVHMNTSRKKIDENDAENRNSPKTLCDIKLYSFIYVYVCTTHSNKIIVLEVIVLTVIVLVVIVLVVNTLFVLSFNASRWLFYILHSTYYILHTRWVVCFK